MDPALRGDEVREETMDDKVKVDMTVMNSLNYTRGLRRLSCFIRQETKFSRKAEGWEKMRNMKKSIPYENK